MDYIEKPRSAASTGRVYCKPVGAPSASCTGVFPSVYSMSWLDRPDRTPEENAAVAALIARTE